MMNYSQAVSPDDYVVVIGGMNMDIFGMPSDKVVDRDSNPGIVGMSVGGVGQNIAQNLAHLEVPTYLITVYGDDYNGQLLKTSCENNHIHLDYAEQLAHQRSSTYMYITDETGDMLVGVNDMDICKQITPEFLKQRLDFINDATICLLDANLDPSTLNWIGAHVTAPLFGDTVSTIKAPHFDGILDKMTVLKPNALEASLLSGVKITDLNTAKRAAEVLLDKGIANIFISMGAQGILCANKDDMAFVKPFKTTIVNANGAGDCGMAAITWSYFDEPDRPLHEIGRIAQAASSIALESDKSVPDITPKLVQQKLMSDTIAN
ncbi:MULTISPECIES: PfkB family carbohydrate kinase [Furfurilactobacillus]|uniref:PfkB family carbohydrate kinase n=1 Tax=Furfurilactobacillus milii TaxID=2888272 RepID=A0ABT6DEY5_9LACO|nr:PfkB family carbohydrate kinase [Furfurilactobacillus milii]QLE65604.1 kinase, PfkB [Furfurilactobacillus rossiae]MCF6161822.1 PfkB family carbohydrate kinase [Furfurilactobacillus milii]MCF6164166.1 PfkB family carbohydrate kinase [Furfurilactobacillus milii]MDF9914709.1 PfkB family carbohydrate kinase [Furfurilactobacillus milii]QLE68034.1 kinase, PfkB family [Furfurilactobacillus rossiae]